MAILPGPAARVARTGIDTLEWPSPRTPDDAELGIGATLAEHSRSGHEVTLLVLSGGEVGGAPSARAAEAAAAATVLGANLLHHDLPDTLISDGKPTVGVVESVVGELVPDVVYLHAAEDTHQDHRAVHRAGIVGSRGVPTVLCFQSRSATVDYRPGRFADVTATMDLKLEALRASAVRCSGSPYPRAAERRPRIVGTEDGPARHGQAGPSVFPSPPVSPHLGAPTGGSRRPDVPSRPSRCSSSRERGAVR